MLYDRDVPTKVRGKFCRTIIIPVMVYESEFWVVKVKHIHKKNVEEMWMLI